MKPSEPNHLTHKTRRSPLPPKAPAGIQRLDEPAGERGEQIYNQSGADRIYRHLIETMSEGAVTLSAEGVILYGNVYLAEMLGRPLDQVLGTALRNYLPPADQQALDTFLARARTEASRGEINLKTSEGRLVPAHLSASRLQSEGAKMVFCLVLTNLTEQKSHEQIAAAERLARLVLEQAAEAIIVCDAQGRVIRASQATQGFCDGSPLLRPFAEVFPLRTDASGPFHLAPVLQGKTLQNVDVSLERQGQKLGFLLNAGPLWSGQQILGCVVTLTDITERKRGEEQIRSQASLLDLARDAIMVQDLDDHILFWNKGAELLYGWTTEEAKDRKINELHQPATDEFLAARVCLLASGQWAGELRQTARDGRSIIVSSRWTLVRDAGGRPTSVLVINIDITDHKKLEAERLRVQRIESIGTLASGIAHDINNILMPIGLIVPMLREQVKDPTALRWLDMVEANVQRGAMIVRQVLTFSRGRRSEKVSTQTRQVLEEVANVIRETFPKTIQLDTKWPKDLWPVLGDGSQLHQVLMNLCINARDAMPEGGILSLTAENLAVDELFACTVPDASTGPFVSWLVADTGQGISPEHLTRIFDPFFTTKEVGKGTGLGLSTTLGIVRDHHGFIRVESKVGGGTRFRVYLPAQPNAAVAPHAPSQPMPQGKGELILVVDDEENIRRVAKAVLERNGYRVLVASEGIEALTLITQNAHRIDALLTDLLMPQMDGLTLIRTLRKLAPHIKMLVVTGGEVPSRSGPLSSEGIKTVLHKPFMPAALLQSLRTLLDEPPPRATAAAPKSLPKHPHSN